MKKNLLHNLNRKVAMASVALITLSTLAGAASGVSAASVTDSQFAPNKTQDRTLSIHANAGGTKISDNTNGVKQDSVTNNISNVTFSIIRIKPNANESVKTMLAGKGALGTYQQDTSFVERTIKTAKNLTTGDIVASIDLGTTNDGYYLVKQVTTGDGIIAMSPFIAQVPMNSSTTTADGKWTYDVNVYPKLNMDMTAGSDKLVNWSATDHSYKQATVFAGDDVTWSLAQGFSKTMLSDTNGTSTYGTYSFEDELNDNLIFNPNGNSISFKIGTQKLDESNAITDGGTITLTEGTDYSVKLDGANPITGAGGKVTFSLTDQGITDILGNDAYKAITSDTTQKAVFITNLTTTVSSKFKVGQIGNSYTATMTNAYGVDLSNGPSNNIQPSDDPTGNNPTATPSVYLGAVMIHKIDSVSKTGINGVTFAIASSQAYANDGNYIRVNKITGELYASERDVPTGVETVPYTVTTSTVNGVDGSAEFDGLKLTDNTNAPATSEDQTRAKYYLVETDAPKEYQKEFTTTNPLEVTASYNPTSLDINKDVTNNLDGSNIHLPFTGGQGMIGLVVVAGIAAGASLVIRRRRNTDED